MAISINAKVCAQQPVAEKINVFAAGSLRDAINELGQTFEKETGIEIHASFGPSGKLHADIEAGRSVDVFASASIDHTDALRAKKLLQLGVCFR